MLYVNAYMWNLEKWYRGTYLRGWNKDADVEKRCVGTGAGGGWDEGRLGLMYAHCHVEKDS